LKLHKEANQKPVVVIIEMAADSIKQMDQCSWSPSSSYDYNNQHYASM